MTTTLSLSKETLMLNAHKAGVAFANRSLGDVNAARDAHTISNGLTYDYEVDAFLGGFYGARRRASVKD